MDDQHTMLSKRQAMAGSFEFYLIESWFKASRTNQEILEKAFENTQFNLKLKKS